MDISKLLEGIDALDEFNAEDTPGLAQVPIEQRVQGLLTDTFGVEWATAEVYTWALPTGHHIHIAVGPNGIKMVGEYAQGELALAAPLPHDAPDTNLSEQSWTYANECACMADIFPALAESRAIIARLETLSPAHRDRLCDQIGHAASHLQMNLDLWRENEARQEGDIP